MVKNAASDGRPHPEERAREKVSANSNARARVSKDEDGPLHAPSCFETHRSAVRQRKGSTLLSRCDAPQHEGRRALRILAKRTPTAIWPNEASIPRSCPRKRGPMITGRCSWVPALAPLGRDDDPVARRTQPAAVGNERRHTLPVSCLFFTGNPATSTCPGVGQVLARDANYRLPSSRRTLVTSLPAARMRAIASPIGSNATAMWKALA